MSSSAGRSYKTQSEADLNQAISVIYELKNRREASGLRGFVGVFSGLFGKESSAKEVNFYEKLPADFLREGLAYEKKAAILADFLNLISWVNVDGRRDGEFMTNLRSLLTGCPVSVQNLFTGVGGTSAARKIEILEESEKAVGVPEMGTEMVSMKAPAPKVAQSMEGFAPGKFLRVLRGGGRSPVPLRATLEEEKSTGLSPSRRGSADATDGSDSSPSPRGRISDTYIINALARRGREPKPKEAFEIDNSAVKPRSKPFDPMRDPWTEPL
jgi:hypothetical protein